MAWPLTGPAFGPVPFFPWPRKSVGSPGQVTIPLLSLLPTQKVDSESFFQKFSLASGA